MSIFSQGVLTRGQHILCAFRQKHLAEDDYMKQTSTQTMQKLKHTVNVF